MPQNRFAKRTRYRRILAISYQNNGDYRNWLRDTQGASEIFRKKRAIDEQSFAADPANAQAQVDLAYSCQRIGELLAESGDHSQAILFYQRAIEMYRKAMVVDPQDW